MLQSEFSGTGGVLQSEFSGSGGGCCSQNFLAGGGVQLEFSGCVGVWPRAPRCAPGASPGGGRRDTPQGPPAARPEATCTSEFSGTGGGGAVRIFWQGGGAAVWQWQKKLMPKLPVPSVSKQFDLILMPKLSVPTVRTGKQHGMILESMTSCHITSAIPN